MGCCLWPSSAVHTNCSLAMQDNESLAYVKKVGAHTAMTSAGIFAIRFVCEMTLATV
jgi:hypothetical protein